MNDIHFVNKRVEYFYNKCNMSFLLRNKLFKHLRETCRKFKIFFETAFESSDAAFGVFDAIFQISGFAVFMINNAKVITIIYFIAKLRDAIVKSNYNFRN